MSEQRRSAREEIKQPYTSNKSQKKLYIYAQVDIDKAFQQITGKSKKVQKYLEAHKLDFEFLEKMRNYKNLRICFDNEIQKFIHNKELSADLRLFKKNVFISLEDFIIERFKIYQEDVQLHESYKAKVEEVQEKFAKRMRELMRGINQQS